MQSKTILNEFGKPAQTQFGYLPSRPSWRKTEDALDRTPITLSEERVLPFGNRIELLTVLRDLERNNPICRSIVNVFVSNVGGCRYRSETPEGISKEEKFKNYFRNLEVTGFGMNRVLAHIVTDLLLAGEAFILLTKGGQIQLIPSERIASQNYISEQKKENEIEGIVLNKFGRPIEYRIANIKNGAVDYQDATYVKAKDIIHIANTSRIGQLRGVPMLASACKTLQDIHEVQTAFTAKVKTSSALTGFITSNQPYSARWDGNEFAEENVRSTYKKLYSGSLLILENGESVQTIQGGNIDGVDTFMLHLISYACASVGITVENLVGWSNASFSSSKATRAVTNHRFNQLREFLEDGFLRRLCRWKQYKWENVDDLPMQTDEDRDNFSFQWTSSPTLDRRQDAQTDAILMKENLASPTTIFSNNGMDYETELEKIITDKRLLKEKMESAGLAEAEENPEEQSS